MLKRIFFSDTVIFSAIVINTIVIFLMAFPDWSAEPILLNLDYYFIIFFLIEALVKLFYLKPKGYFKDGWNRFDFFLVIVSLPSLLEGFFNFPDTSLVLLFRLLRLLRLVRLFRFIPNLNHIITGLGRALKASVFVLIALLFLNFFLALFTCYIYGGVVPEYFGDPMISLYTIFQMFTVEGWYEIPSLIAEKADSKWAGGFARLYFVLVVLMGGIFGMSLANAVFVDEMTMDNNKELENKIDDLQVKINQLQNTLEKMNK